MTMMLHQIKVRKGPTKANRVEGLETHHLLQLPVQGAPSPSSSHRKIDRLIDKSFLALMWVNGWHVPCLELQ
jgi:hypothetical protein